MTLTWELARWRPSLSLTLILVARYGLWHRESHEVMFCLSEIVASTYYCSSTFPGMTISTMEQNTFGLCWSLLGHVITPGWHAFKMVGYPHHTVHYCCQDHWEVTNHVIRRKGLPIMEYPWISIVHVWEWHSSHYYGTLPSIKQWPHRTGCANLQMWFQSYPRWLYSRENSQNVLHHAPYYCWAITCSVAQGSSLVVMASQTVSWYARTHPE